MKKFAFKFKEYRKAGNLKLYQKSSSLEVEGYMRYPRVKEPIRLAEGMGWNKLGMAFCIGLSEEAKKLQEVLKCTVLKFIRLCVKLVALRRKNSLPERKRSRMQSNSPSDGPQRGWNGFERHRGSLHRPRHLFQRYSKAPTTTLIVKDRVLAHNPVGALYSRYHFKKLLR
ncbi:MAG: DUF1847 domain-containing protein [Candidatus Hodarchaeaceae archaeon]|nr:DUF1847 domain-containing protein [Candidatus Hodarchaeaceae archaeon]